MSAGRPGPAAVPRGERAGSAVVLLPKVYHTGRRQINRQAHRAGVERVGGTGGQALRSRGAERNGGQVLRSTTSPLLWPLYRLRGYGKIQPRVRAVPVRAAGKTTAACIWHLSKALIKEGMLYEQEDTRWHSGLRSNIIRGSYVILHQQYR